MLSPPKKHQARNNLLKVLVIMKNIVSAAAIAIASAISFLVSPANAQIPTPTNNWHPVAQGQNGSLALIDNGSIGRNGNLVGFWFQINSPNNNVHRMYALANCSNNTYQTLWSVIAQNGQITHNSAVSDSPAFVPAGSIGSYAYAYACSAPIDLVRLHLEALTRSSQTSAEMINRAMIEAARLAR